jgi:hypothetical protein
MATNDDVRTNNVLPEKAQRLRVDGMSGIVTVTRIEQTNLLDGNQDPISNIFIKGANRAATALLPRNYINTQENYTILADEEEAQPSRQIVDADWEVGDPDGLIGTKVRKYFKKHGWNNGEVISVRSHSTSGEVLYNIEYDDSDVEDLDQKEFDDVFAEAQFVPHRTAPPEVLALLSPQQKSAGESNNGATVSPVQNQDADKEEKAKEAEEGEEDQGGGGGGGSGEGEAPQPVSDPPHLDVSALVQLDVSKLLVGAVVIVLRKTGSGFVELRCERVCEDGRDGVRLFHSEGEAIKTCFDNDAQESLTMPSANNIVSFFLKPDGDVSDADGSDGNKAPSCAAGDGANPQAAESASSSSSELVPYTGAVYSLGETIARTNNSGLFFSSAYGGLSDTGVIKEEGGQQNEVRTIPTINRGGTIVVMAAYPRKPLSMINFSIVLSDGRSPKRLPVLFPALAEIPLKNRTLMPEDATSRGSLYVSKQAPDAFTIFEDDEPASQEPQDLVLVHLLLTEEKHQGEQPFFGMSRLVVSNLSPRYPNRMSGVRIVNNSAISKSPLTDEEASKALQSSESDIRSLATGAEANFVAWWNGGSPLINNGNWFEVNRGTGPDGKPFIELEEPDGDANPETGKAPSKKKKQSRLRTSGNAAKAPRLTSVSETPQACDDDEVDFSSPENFFPGGSSSSSSSYSSGY